MPRRWGRRLTAALAMASAALFATASLTPASATTQGCTYTGFMDLGKYVCGTVFGSGLRVDKVQVIRGKFEVDTGVLVPLPISDYRAEVKFTYPNGSSTTILSSTHYGDWWAGRATRTIDVGNTFPDGTVACLSFYENINDLQGTVCKKIHN
jgi:hypothetical protein